MQLDTHTPILRWNNTGLHHWHHNKPMLYFYL